MDTNIRTILGAAEKISEWLHSDENVYVSGENPYVYSVMVSRFSGIDIHVSPASFVELIQEMNMHITSVTDLNPNVHVSASFPLIEGGYLTLAAVTAKPSGVLKQLIEEFRGGEQK